MAQSPFRKLFFTGGILLLLFICVRYLLPVLLPFALISFVTTILVFAAGGLVTKWMIGRGKKDD